MKMHLSRILLVAATLLSFTLNAAVVDPKTPQNSRLRITNQCEKEIWIQQDYLHFSADPIVVKIPRGMAYDYAIPANGLPATRFWAKRDCNEHGYDCVVGESTAVPAAIDNGWQHGPFAPDINSKFEATWGCAENIYNNNPKLCAENPSAPGEYLGTETWWNGSAVDGYTFPYVIKVKNHNKTCRDIQTGIPLENPGVDCSNLSAEACPDDANLSTEGKYNTINGVNVTNVDLRWVDIKTRGAIGCFSPCSKLTTAQGSENGELAGGWKYKLGGLEPASPEAKMYCCPTPPVLSGECSAGPAARSSYSQSVKEVQKCNSYTYAYDDAQGLARCGFQTQFELVVCGKEQNPPDNNVASLKLISPTNMSLVLDGAAVTNGQTLSIKNGSVISPASTPTSVCTLGVDSNLKVSTVTGTFCSQIVIDNTLKTLTVKDKVQPGGKMQFNLNTSVGIVAYLETTLIVNGQQMELSKYLGTKTLSATQNNKNATCLLTITNTSVTKGTGEFCNRLSIFTDANQIININLPADIPDMGPPPPTTNSLAVFCMDSTIRAMFNNQVVVNGSQVRLDSLPESKTVSLVATQGSNTSKCDLIRKSNDLSIVPNSGALCTGLVLVKQSNGDYFIALPNPIPGGSGPGPDPGPGEKFSLGIPQGMTIVVGSQTVRWDSADKTVILVQGKNTFNMTNSSNTKRSCTVTLNNRTLSIPGDAGCAGIVQQGSMIYFPAFLR